MFPAIVIELFRGTHLVQTFELPARPLVNLGRHGDNDVVVPPDEQLVSGHHAQLRQDGGGWVLHDQNSMNGLFVASRRVRSCAVEVGSEVELGSGGARLVFRRLPGPGRATAPALPIARSAMAATIVPHGLARPRGVDAATGDGRAIGARTAGVMIQSALAQASGRDVRRWRRIGAILVAAVGLSLGGLAVALARTARRQRPAAVEPGAGDPGKRVVADNSSAVAMLLIEGPYGQLATCTAFAVRPRLLASNAHCVALLGEAADLELRASVVPNRDPVGRMRVVGWYAHPGYSAGSSEVTMDVGLIEVDRDLPAVVRLAPPATAVALSPGEAIYVYGFPGAISAVADPEATLVEGVIGRLTNLHRERAAAVDARLLQHSAYVADGTSGSPVFNRAGEVIAINTGTWRLASPYDGGSGYNFAIRIDVLSDLLERGPTMTPLADHHPAPAAQDQGPASP